MHSHKKWFCFYLVTVPIKSCQFFYKINISFPQHSSIISQEIHENQVHADISLTWIFHYHLNNSLLNCQSYYAKRHQVSSNILIPFVVCSCKRWINSPRLLILPTYPSLGSLSHTLKYSCSSNEGFSIEFFFTLLLNFRCICQNYFNAYEELGVLVHMKSSLLDYLSCACQFYSLKVVEMWFKITGGSCIPFTCSKLFTK